MMGGEMKGNRWIAPARTIYTCPQLSQPGPCLLTRNGQPHGYDGQREDSKG